MDGAKRDGRAVGRGVGTRSRGALARNPLATRYPSHYGTSDARIHDAVVLLGKVLRAILFIIETTKSLLHKKMS